MRKKSLVMTNLVCVLIVLPLCTVACTQSSEIQNTEDVSPQVDMGKLNNKNTQSTVTAAQQNAMLFPLSALCCYYDESDFYGSFEDSGWEPLNVLFYNFANELADYTDQVFFTDATSVMVLDSFLREIASAMYSDFNDALPEIKDIDSVYGIQSQTKDGYMFKTSGQYPDKNFIIKSWAGSDSGTDIVVVTETTSDTDYEFELKRNNYTSSNRDSDFKYSVCGMSIIKDDVLEQQPEIQEQQEPQEFKENTKEDTEEESEEEIIKEDTEEINGNISDENKEDAEKSSNTSGDYILPDSGSKYYDANELGDMSDEDLRLARNEIYAKHGYIFDSDDLNEYFRNKDWYEPGESKSSFDYESLNEYEQANIDTILDVESKR